MSRLDSFKEMGIFALLAWMVVTTGLERLEREELGRFLHHCFTLLLFGSASEADGFFLTDVEDPDMMTGG